MANPKITLTGNIGQDPESIADGKGLRLRVATKDRIKNGNDWADGETSWWTVKLWNSQAEYSKNLLKKGQEITVFGTIAEETWKDKKTGETRSSYAISADTVSVTARTLSKQNNNKTFSDDIWTASDDPGVAPF